jgi:hypothetical protein
VKQFRPLEAETIFLHRGVEIFWRSFASVYTENATTHRRELESLMNTPERRNDSRQTMSALYDNDAYDLALLAAQLLSRQNSPVKAIEMASSLLEQAALKLEKVKLEAKSPEVAAELEKRRAEQLANLAVAYEKGVKIITGADRWSGYYGALTWFKRFLATKAKKDRRPEECEAWVEAKLNQYRNKGFTGAEAKKLQAEFEQWRSKGRQGRVRKPKRDGRLRENRLKKAQQTAGAAWRELNGRRERTKPELVSVADTEAVEAKQASSGKTPRRGAGV